VSSLVGRLAPSFTLRAADGSGEVSLADYHGKKPVVLVFGSYTCPLFRNHVDELNAAYDRYKDRAEFFLIYLREAHPAEQGQIPGNEELGLIWDPQSLEERSQMAERCAADLGFKMRVLVDDMQDRTSQKFEAAPTRLCVIAPDGEFAYASIGIGRLIVPAMTESLDSLLR
jgi:hypothetical protein